MRAGLLGLTMLLGLGGPAVLRPTAAAGADVAGPADFHVAPDGNDTGDGTAARPFATVARARDAVRVRLASMRQAQPAAGARTGITVLIRGGTYRLAEPLVFGPDDSGTDACPVLYAAAPGQTPVLSGGRAVTSWQKGQGGVWTVPLAAVREGTWHFRQLFVDGRRAVRARTPNASDAEYCYLLADAKLAKDLSSYTLTLGPDKVKRWNNLRDVEVVVLKNWATLHKRIEEVDPATGLVTLQKPHVAYFGGNSARKGKGCFFENALEFLDQPGEWHLDRPSGVLSYRPLEGQDMAKAEAVAPVLAYLVEVAGTPERPVRNLHFRGLALRHTHLALPPEGHEGRQAAFRCGADNFAGAMPCAVRFRYAERCSLVGSEVAHVGGGAVDLGEGCRHNLIEGNAVFDAEGNGINVGGPDRPDRVPQDNRIANNYVHHCGAVYYGACGIWAGFAQKTAIEHNLVCALPYTGISIGWKWNASPSTAREYLVEHNDVHDVMRQVCDGGAIYSLGLQPGTVLRANLLYDVHRSRYAAPSPNNGIFIDEGSTGFLIEGNVIFRTSGEPIRHNKNKKEDHTWKDNLFAKEVPASIDAGLLRQVGPQEPWRRRLLGHDRPTTLQDLQSADGPA